MYGLLGGTLIGRIAFPDWAMLRCVDVMHFRTFVWQWLIANVVLGSS